MVDILAERDVVTVQFDLISEVKILVVSVYLPTQKRDVDITYQLELLQDLLDSNDDKSIIIVGDMNALPKTNARGHLILELCAHND